MELEDPEMIAPRSIPNGRGLVKSMILEKIACEDKHPSCFELALLGECEKNPDYILKNCCFSRANNIPVQQEKLN